VTYLCVPQDRYRWNCYEILLLIVYASKGIRFQASKVDGCHVMHVCCVHECVGMCD
jgi:hypothetical protein